MKAIGAIIERVIPDTIAAELELTAGDEIVSVNGVRPKDLIDMQIACSDEVLSLVIRDKSGVERAFEIEKDYDETLGVVMQSAVFDKMRVCANKCVFCFVDQMPEGMRHSLYIKDDDYRMSFLSGSFVTLSNLKDKDYERIDQLNLSPLYISVHTTDDELREKMLGTALAAPIMQQLQRLIDMDAELHLQIVLCPGYNDGFALERTLRDLYKFREQIISLAIVPIGLTKYREHLAKMQSVTPAIAQEVITQVRKWQDRARYENDYGNFIYLSDEFYLLAGIDLPQAIEYADYPQLENGVGIARSFIEDWHSCRMLPQKSQARRVGVVCGVLAKSVIGSLLNDVAIENTAIKLLVVENEFFGKSVTVTGLLTGQDILRAVNENASELDEVILPAVVLRKEQAIFLDDMTLEEFKARCTVKVRVADGAVELKQRLFYWNMED